MQTLQDYRNMNVHFWQGCRKNAAKRTATAENRTKAAWLHCGYCLQSLFVSLAVLSVNVRLSFKHCTTALWFLCLWFYANSSATCFTVCRFCRLRYNRTHKRRYDLSETGLRQQFDVCTIISRSYARLQQDGCAKFARLPQDKARRRN